MNAQTLADSATRQPFFYSRCPGIPTISNLAAQLGYLDEELSGKENLGVKLECVSWEHDDERYWMRHSSHVNAAWDRASGKDCVVVAISWLDGSYPVYATRRSGIASIAELKGRRIGVMKSTLPTLDFWRAQNLKTFESALSSADLSLDDVTLVDVPRPPRRPDDGRPRFNMYAEASRGLVAALVREEVDAIAATLPPEIVDYLDLERLYDSGSDPDLVLRVNPSVLRCLVVSGPMLRDQRDLVVRILARLLQAAEWAAIHPDETVKLLARDMNMSEEALLAVYQHLANGVQIDSTDRLIDVLNTQQEFLYANGFIDARFDMSSWIDVAPLEEARTLLAQWKAEGSQPA